MPRPTAAAVWAGRLSRLGDAFASPFHGLGRTLNRQLAGLTCDHHWRYSKSRGRQVCRHCRATRPLR